jgi:hypothetical protein
MTHDMAELFALREHDHYAIHRRHLNEQMVRVLKAIGYDVGFCRGKGQYRAVVGQSGHLRKPVCNLTRPARL